MDLARRIKRIQPSPTLAFNAKALSLKAQGVDIINLCLGEPDFDTPDPIKEAAITAIREGFTKYTAVEGILPLREAIAKKCMVDHYSPQQIIVSNGAKQALYNLMWSLLNPGDEVIIPAPYWVSYPDMVLLHEAKPIILATTFEQNFKISATQLEQAITPKTKLFIMNSPSNPTGIAYTASELQAFAKVLEKHPAVFIVSDDIYEAIMWQPKSFSNLGICCSALIERMILIHGLSKAYAMTGWRIGYAAGPLPIIQAMNILQSQSTSNPCSIAQKAALFALTCPQDFIPPMVQAFKERHDYVVRRLNQIKGIECHPNDGTFYVFPRVTKAIQALKLEDDIAFAHYLLEMAEVAIVPGSVFGTAGFIRLSFASSMDILETALNRIEATLGSLA